MDALCTIFNPMLSRSGDFDYFSCYKIKSQTLVCIFLESYPGKAFSCFRRSFMIGIRSEIDKQALFG